MADLVTIATTAALTQFVGPVFKHLGEQALEQAKQVASTAAAQLKAVGREPQPVEPKILLPLVQAASLEMDGKLADRWAALLANAADPAQRVAVQPGFTEVLRQLTPLDATVLARLYKQAVYKEADALYYELPSIVTRGMATELGITDKQFAVSIETLLRLRLAAPPIPMQGGFDRATTGRAAAARQVCPTVFGFEFIAAVTAPAP